MRSPNSNHVAGEQPQAEILHIIPKLSTEARSVSSYAFHIAKKLWQDYQIASHFLVCQRSDGDPLTEGDFPVFILPQKTSRSFAEQIPARISHILVHYSGASYAKGKMDAPFWLQEGLQMVVRSRQLPVFLLFHDLPSADLNQMKWVNPIGGMVAYRIAKQADVAIAFNVRLQAILGKWLQRDVRCIPQSAYMRELRFVPSLCDRYQRAVVMGSHSHLHRYERKWETVVEACQHLDIDEIYDIAPTLQVQVATAPNFDWMDTGKMLPGDVAYVLLNSRVGFFSHRTATNLEDSEIFAAYCAHGLLPIGLDGVPDAIGSLQLGTHYLQIPVPLAYTSEEKLQAIADRAHQWYRDHRWYQHARFFASLILD